MNWKLLILSFGAAAVMVRGAEPAPAANFNELAFKPVEDRSVFTPTNPRPSPFSEVDETKAVERPIGGKRVGLNEMLVEFVHPRGSNKKADNTYEVLVNNRFYGLSDVMRLEVTLNPSEYDYPLAELSVTAIGSDYIELYYRPNKSSNRITFSVMPELHSEEPKNNLKGANLRYLGTVERVFPNGVEYAEPANPGNPRL